LAELSDAQRFVFEASRRIIGKFQFHTEDIQLAAPGSETAFTSDLLRRCLEEDVNQTFQQTHIEKFPEANFRAIALWKLDNQHWKAIAAATGVPIPTLSAFYQRQVKKFKLQIQAYIQDHSHLSMRDLDL
jgi:hypothetical protein